VTALAAGVFLTAAASYGRKPRRPVKYSPARRYCLCLADKEAGEKCAANCPTREKEDQR
jgi:hypothetical protein